MSTYFVLPVMEDKGITDAYECLVLLALADSAGKDTGRCYLSIQTISEMARCSARKVIRVLHSLEERKWIAVTARFRNNGRQTSNEYELTRWLRIPAGGCPIDRGGCPIDRVEGVHETAEPVLKEPVSNDLFGHSTQKPESRDELLFFCKTKLHMVEGDIDWLWNHWLGNGFTNRGKKMKSWQATATAWCRQGDILPSHRSKVNGHYQKFVKELSQEGNGSTVAASWSPPTIEDIYDYAEYKKWPRSHASKCWTHFLSHGMGYYSNKFANDDQWKAAMCDLWNNQK